MTMTRPLTTTEELKLSSSHLCYHGAQAIEIADSSDHSIIASAFVITYAGDQLFLDSLLVAEAHRSKGYGTLLLDAAIELATFAGLPLVLKAEAYSDSEGLSTEELLAWYLRKGFTPDLNDPRYLIYPRPYHANTTTD